MPKKPEEAPQEEAKAPSLRLKERAFVEFYVQSWNAAKAARLAGYSERSAKEIGYENLTKPHIQKAVEERAQILLMTPAEWGARVTAQARASLEDFLTDQGEVDLQKAKEADQLGMLSEYWVKETTRQSAEGHTTTETQRRIKLHSSQAALKMIGERIGSLRSDAEKELIEEQLDMLRLKKEEYLKRDEILTLLRKRATKDTYHEVLNILAMYDDCEEEEETQENQAESKGEV